MFKLSFKRQVLTGFAISLLFVLLSAVTSYLSVERLNESTVLQSHTYDVINIVKDVETKVLNAETGIRGFVLSGDRQYLMPYTRNAQKILPTIQELKNQIADNPEQRARIDSLDFYAHARIDEMQEVLRIYDAQGQQAAASRIMQGLGQLYTDKIQSTKRKIIEMEQQLLSERKKNIANSSRQSEWVVLLSSGIIFCLILFLFSYIKKTFDQQRQIETHIRESNIKLENVSAENEQKNWLLSGAAAVNEAMRGEQEVDELANRALTTLCQYLNAQVGAIYLSDTSRMTFKFTAGYAFKLQKNSRQEYHLGEGLIGQAAVEKQVKLLASVPEDYLKISSGLGECAPQTIYVLPVLFEDETWAVIELGFSEQPHHSSLLLLNTVSESIGVSLNSAVARMRLRDLFEQIQQQAEELESQQEELRTTNEELMYKTEQLQSSEEELKVQQEELRQTNAELEEKALQLEERNILVNQAREAMSLKAEELEISSKYKSEFLANMSHELRTPLNSILILARILKENRNENLTEDQIKYAGVIHTAGNDLLTLINDILDLSKIESGKIDLTIEPLKPIMVKNDMEALFGELARSKKINYTIQLSDRLPEFILTDQGRLEQIIKNLLSNAFKFTSERGEISLKVNTSTPGTSYYSDQLKTYSGRIVSFSVEDSGIGIAKEKQKLIFEAFHQADGSTSRKYGGTGLGLSISKELAQLLGGEIQVKSEPNIGSTFTLYIPESHTIELAEDVDKEDHRSPLEPVVPALEQTVLPTIDAVQTLLIVEDDVVFADVLKDYALERGFGAILAHDGDSGLRIAISELPDAIVLDVMLPMMDGWEVLKKLKSDPRTKHIPVHMMSAANEKESKAKKEGAIGFLKKPIEKDQLDEAFKLLTSAPDRYDFDSVLVIEDQELHSTLLTSQLREKGIAVKQAFTGKEALELLKVNKFDCIILDLKLPDFSGFELLDIIKSQPSLVHIPVIINTAMELDDHKMAHIMRYSEAMVLKSNKSNDRLIDEVSLFMNKLKHEGKFLPAAASGMKGKAVSTIEKVLRDKTVLITDDDMRNIFALSSALELYEMKIIIANNGREALDQLDKVDDIDLVLMDIMMPEMDGYQAIKSIRSDKRFVKLPIIALTAKAMKNDREKCIEAGANDYIPKPVDIDKLLSMLRVWLS